MTTTPSVKAVYCFDPSTERVFVGPEVAPNVLGEVFYVYRWGSTWEAFTNVGQSSRVTMQEGSAHPWAAWLRARNDEILKQIESMYQGDAQPISSEKWLQYRVRTTHPDDIKDRKP